MSEPKCDCRHPECTTCNPTDPTAAELARIVAWLRARAAFLRRLADQLGDEGSVYRNQENGLLFAAADLERGEQP